MTEQQQTSKAENEVVIERSNGSRSVWTRDMLLRLRDMTDRYAGTKTLFEMISERPDTDVSLPEVAEKAGVPFKTAQNHLAHLGRLTRQEWGNEQIWPFHIKGVPIKPTRDHQRGKTHAYAMPPDMARLWRSL